MNLYEINYYNHDFQEVQTMRFQHEQNYSQEQFEDIIKWIRFDLGHSQNEEEVFLKLKKQGFKKVVSVNLFDI